METSSIRNARVRILSLQPAAAITNSPIARRSRSAVAALAWATAIGRDRSAVIHGPGIAASPSEGLALRLQSWNSKGFRRPLFFNRNRDPLHLWASRCSSLRRQGHVDEPVKVDVKGFFLFYQSWTSPGRRIRLRTNRLLGCRVPAVSGEVRFTSVSKSLPVSRQRSKRR